MAGDFRDPVEARERAARVRQTRIALGHAFRRLNPLERRLMALRYRQSLSVNQIAGLLNLDAKRLYRTFDRLVGKLRRDLGSSGKGDLTLPC